MPFQHALAPRPRVIQAYYIFLHNRVSCCFPFPHGRFPLEYPPQLSRMLLYDQKYLQTSDNVSSKVIPTGAGQTNPKPHLPGQHNPSLNRSNTFEHYKLPNHMQNHPNRTNLNFGKSFHAAKTAPHDSIRLLKR
jgi:hypothetical protein